MHAFLLKEVEADRLVALGCDVHDVETVLVLQVHICAIVEQFLAHYDVSSEGSVMDGSKLVFLGLLVDPPCYILLLHLLRCSLH